MRGTIMPMHTILLPTDFSPYAERACHQGFALAARKKAQVLLLHVLRSANLAFGDTPVPMRKQLEHAICVEAEERLKVLAASQTVPVETLVVWGNPVPEICRIAKERGTDLSDCNEHPR